MILVTGSRGNLGQVVCRKLSELGMKVLGTRRPHQEIVPGVDEAVIDNWNITIPQEFQITLIIHLANSYKTRINELDIQDVVNSNVGMATSIAQLQHRNQTPIITLGSFFERAPQALQPWSYYSCSKIVARSILSESAELMGSKLVYIYIYDTYGGSTQRGKFIDVLVNTIHDPKPFSASPGQQVQDLTHIEDIADGIVHAAMGIDTFQQPVTEFQMASGEIQSLRELVSLAEKVCGFTLPVKWGALPYRQREVFEIWNSAPTLPFWQPNWNLRKFFQEIVLRKDQEEFRL